MKLVINGMAIEIMSEASVCYDAGTDTLEISTRAKPIKLASTSVVKQIAAPVKRGKYKKAKAKVTVIPPPAKEMSKTVLMNKILAMLDGKTTPVSAMWITMQTLGRNSGIKNINYLKLLLNELAEAGRIVESTSQAGRRKFLPVSNEPERLRSMGD